MPEDQTIRPPDQVSAGATPAAPDQGGIIDALRSRGPAPQAALQNIAGPNVGSAFGSGVLGALAGQPGSNPYLTQQAQFQKDAFYQQLNQQREQRAKAAQAFRQNEAVLKIQGEVLDKMDPSSPLYPKVAGAYAKQISQFTGNPLYGELGADFATKKIDAKEASAIIAEAKSGLSPELIQELHPGVRPDKIKKILSADPKMMELWGVENEQARQASVAKLQESRAKAWATTHPEWGDTDLDKGLPGYGDELVRRTYGKSLFELGDGPADQIIREQALDYARSRAKLDRAKKSEEALAQKQAESDIIERREKAVAKEKAADKNLAGPKPASASEVKARLAPFNTAATSLSNLEAMEGSVDRMDKKGLLPSGSNRLQTGQAAFQRWWNSDDPDVRFLAQLTGPEFIGIIDRGLNDEKGARAMQMFHAQIELVQKNPTAETYHKLFDYYRYLHGRIVAKQLRVIERQEGRIDQAIVDEARSQFKELYPDGVPLDPSTPLPAGAHWEKGFIVSNDGQHISKDGRTWQNR